MPLQAIWSAKAFPAGKALVTVDVSLSILPAAVLILVVDAGYSDIVVEGCNRSLELGAAFESLLVTHELTLFTKKPTQVLCFLACLFHVTLLCGPITIPVSLSQDETSWISCEKTPGGESVQSVHNCWSILGPTTQPSVPIICWRATKLQKILLNIYSVLVQSKLQQAVAVVRTMPVGSEL